MSDAGNNNVEGTGQEEAILRSMDAHLRDRVLLHRAALTQRDQRKGVEAMVTYEEDGLRLAWWTCVPYRLVLMTVEGAYENNNWDELPRRMTFLGAVPHGVVQEHLAPREHLKGGYTYTFVLWFLPMGDPHAFTLGELEPMIFTYTMPLSAAHRDQLGDVAAASGIARDVQKQVRQIVATQEAWIKEGAKAREQVKASGLSPENEAAVLGRVAAALTRLQESQNT